MRTVSKTSLINKRLKKGYTTGTCAAAAAKASAQMLLSGEVVKEVEVKLPGGERVSIKTVEQVIDDERAGCGVVKDAGDDPDVTHGMTIYASVKRSNADISILGGEGIGTVTKPGLSVPVGEPAINPIPRTMIKENVRDVMPGGEGLEVTIYAPEGVDRAKRTFNKKLGIVGGISILGTTGIVRPMSLASLKESLYPQIDVAAAQGHKTVALVPGNMGEKVAKSRLGFPEDAVVQMSNFVGEMLDYCVEKGIENILLLGHIGKIAKVAGGFFDTHSKSTDDPVEIMKRLLRKKTRDTAPLMYLVKVNTAEEAAIGLSELGHSRLLDKIAEESTLQARRRVNNSINIGTAITVLSGDIVATDAGANKIIEDCKW